MIQLVEDYFAYETIGKTDYISLRQPEEIALTTGEPNPLREFLTSTLNEYFGEHPETNQIISTLLGIRLHKKTKNWTKQYKVKDQTTALNTILDLVSISGKGPSQIIKLKKGVKPPLS